MAIAAVYVPQKSLGRRHLEWLTEMPGRSWGVRLHSGDRQSLPFVGQPNFVRDVDEGKFYLPDAEEGERENTGYFDYRCNIVYCLRVPGPDVAHTLGSDLYCRCLYCSDLSLVVDNYHQRDTDHSS